MRGAGGTPGGLGGFLAGAAMVVLFFDGRSIGGWALTAIGAITILAGIVANLRIYFRTTSLFDTLVMLGLLAGGLGLIARSLRASGTDPAGYGSSLG
ncbi:MAG TPA: hypothetical protein VJQ44_11400 [Gemmatimonadales bacterium]|nr:hypothetical protein [Gemmatimonadales bacterium]